LQNFDGTVETITFGYQCCNYFGDGHKSGWYHGESPIWNNIERMKAFASNLL